MATAHDSTALNLTPTAVPQPDIRKIGMMDLVHAVQEGIADFKIKPMTHLPLLMVLYPLATAFAFLFVFRYETLPLAFPIVSGSLLLGPVVTIGLYEMSRRVEHGEDISGLQAFNFLRSPALGDVLLLAAFIVALFFLWLATAMTLFDMTLGDPWQSLPPASLSFGAFFHQLFATSQGWTLIVAGNVVGLVFAVAVLSVSVVSFPMLLDRNVGLGMAIQTSVRAVAANPLMMAIWGLFLVAVLIVGAIPFLVGLAVVTPILGHASWHLYRKLVV